MKKLVIMTVIFLTMILTGGNTMADKNIQMGQRNESNTEWDNHYPITKAENVLTESGTVASQLAEIPNQYVAKVEGKGLSTNDYTNTDKAEVAKVVSKTDKAYVDTVIASLASGSPKGVFATLAALQADATANTTEGKKSIYLVSADGKWYYWNDEWTPGGVYQSTGMADKSVRANFLDEIDIYDKKVYVDAKLDSDAGAINYLSGIYDLGSTRITSAVFRAVVSIKGSVIPTSIGVKLFANNSSERDNIDGYVVTYANLVVAPTANGKYELTCNYVESSGANNLNNYRYLKPFLMFGKESSTVIHNIIIESYELEIGELKASLLESIQDYAPLDGSEVTVVRKDKYFAFYEDIASANASFAGQVLNGLGDSIVFGYDPNNGGDKMSEPWLDQIGDMLGFSTVNNYGISGATIATKTSDSNWETTRNPMVNRYQSMADADVILCLGGINDFWLGVPLGTFNSRDTDTFYGALHVLYKGMAEIYPTKKLFVMTCLYYDGTNPNGVTLEQWTDAQREVAAYYSIPLFDLYKYSGVNARIDAQSSLIPDGLHPSQDGADILARKIANFIKSL